MAAAVVALPQIAKCVLSAYIPDLEIALVEVDQADILPNGGNGVQSRIVLRIVQAFYLLKQCGLSSIVKAKKEDGVF